MSLTHECKQTSPILGCSDARHCRGHYGQKKQRIGKAETSSGEVCFSRIFKIYFQLLFEQTQTFFLLLFCPIFPILKILCCANNPLLRWPLNVLPRNEKRNSLFFRTDVHSFPEIRIFWCHEEYWCLSRSVITFPPSETTCGFLVFVPLQTFHWYNKRLVVPGS